MFNLKKKLAVAAFVTASTLNVAHAVVVDSFDYSTSVTVNAGQTTDTSGVINTNSSPVGQVVYDLALTDAGWGGDAIAAAHFVQGGMSVDTDTLVQADLSLSYSNDNPAIFDLQANEETSFYVDVVFSDLDVSVDFLVNNTDVITLDIAAGSTGRQFVEFGALDLTAVSSLVVSFDAATSGDFAITEIGTVPEPTSLAILGLGLLGFAASRRKSA